MIKKLISTIVYLSLSAFGAFLVLYMYIIAVVQETEKFW